MQTHSGKSTSVKQKANNENNEIILNIGYHGNQTIRLSVIFLKK